MTRLAAEIGKGLAPARDARAIRRGERIHVLGAAGAGASAAVLLAHRAGADVSGCDPGGPSPYTEALSAAGIELMQGYYFAHPGFRSLPEVDLHGEAEGLRASA